MLVTRSCRPAAGWVVARQTAASSQARSSRQLGFFQQPRRPATVVRAAPEEDLDRLQQDLDRMRQRQAAASGGAPAAARQQQQPTAASTAGGSSSSSGPLAGVKDAVDKLLIADFFFILFALAWLGAALAERSTLQSTRLLDTWLSLWQWVFQPAIGVLMLGAIVSGAVGWAKENLGGQGQR